MLILEGIFNTSGVINVCLQFGNCKLIFSSAKIVINNTTKEVAGWQFPHVAPYPNLGNDLTKFRMPVSQIQVAAGVTYAYPPGTKELQPGQEWPVDFGALTNAKRAKCGANASDD